MYVPCLLSPLYSMLTKLSTRVYSQDLSNRRRALAASSAESYRFADALQAFLRCVVWSSFWSRFASVARLCHIDIDTKGAHSFRTMLQTRLWKSCIR